MSKEDLKRRVCEAIRARRADIKAVAESVFAEPELGFKEEKSAAALIAALESEGFKVTTGLAGIPTAFVGVWGEGHPAIAPA